MSNAKRVTAAKWVFLMLPVLAVVGTILHRVASPLKRNGSPTSGNGGSRRSPRAPLAPYQPRLRRDVARALERGGVGRGSRRVQEGARAQESDPARGVVQLGPCLISAAIPWDTNISEEHDGRSLSHQPA